MNHLSNKRGRHPHDCQCPIHAEKIGDNANVKNEQTDKNTIPNNEGQTENETVRSIEDIINDGSPKDNIVPPIDGNKTPITITEKPIDTKVNLPTFGKAFWKYLGDGLADITSINTYRLSDSRAQDFEDIFNAVAKKHKWQVDCDMAFVIMLLMWLIFPTLQFLQSKGLFKGITAKIGGWFDGLLGKKKKESELECTTINPPVTSIPMNLNQPQIPA